MIRVLVVEDEQLSRKGLILTTRWSDYDMEVVAEAKDGKEGLELTHLLNPDVIITDIKMPNLNGLEMIQKILESHDVAIIMISAYSDFEYAQEAIKLGAIDYVLKPFSDDELDKALRKAQRAVTEKALLRQSKVVSRNEIKNAIDRYLSKSNRSQHENMKQIIYYISENYNKDISLSTVAEALDVSESTISRTFRSETSYSFNDYLTIYRLKIATKMLENPNIKIYEVANAVGYRDQRYFSSVFKKHIGVTPNNYKESFGK